MRFPSLTSALSRLLILWLCCCFQLIRMAESRKCYSCMSKFYGQMWEYLGYNQMYLDPKGFTDHCDNPTARGSDVGTIECDAYSNCISFVENIKQGVGNKGYIRGCFNSIFKWGFNRTADGGRLQYREFCRPFNLSSLIQGSRPFNSMLVACSCRGHLCNGSETNSANSNRFLLAGLTLCALLSTHILRLL